MAAHLELRIDSTKEVHAVCLDVDLASVAGPVKPAELRMDDELLSCLLGQVPVSARDVHTADTELANLSMEQWLQLIGLERFADAYPHQLSGGMKQRVAIVRALANQPRILLMDEPFGALDAQTRCRMQAHLLEIWRKIDITIVFITHDLDEAIFLADRILVLSAHPGEVRELIEVPVPRPRNAAQLISPAFLATKARLEDLIHQSKSDDDEEAESYAMVARLTEVSDNVD